MEFRDLKKQYLIMKSEMDSAIAKVIRETNFISGNQVTDLEKKLSNYVGTEYCVTCGNGTDALSMVLMYWEIGTGDAVFVPDFTFFASGEVVAFEGATPVFVDVDEVTFNMDPSKLEDAIQAVLREGILNPKAIIPVDLFGLPAAYEEINIIARKYDLKILEDGAQGFGGSCKGKRACSFGDAATTSFFPAKPLGCYGDGGAIFTNDTEMYSYLKSIQVHGKGMFKYDNVRIGWNSRLDTIQAAVLMIKLEYLEHSELEAVNKVASLYNQLLDGIVHTPNIPEHYFSSWAQYTIKLENRKERDELQEHLKINNIPSIVYYPKPMHSQKAFTVNKHYQLCPVTEYLCNTVLSLPMHPYLTTEQIVLVCDTIKSFISTQRKVDLFK